MLIIHIKIPSKIKIDLVSPGSYDKKQPSSNHVYPETKSEKI